MMHEYASGNATSSEIESLHLHKSLQVRLSVKFVKTIHKRNFSQF